jgi:hypothetical protein
MFQNDRMIDKKRAWQTLHLSYGSVVLRKYYQRGT